MKHYLFPNRYKIITGFIFYLSAVLGAFLYFTGADFDRIWVIKVPSIIKDSIFNGAGGLWISNGILDELILIILIVSGILHSFSKEKTEDEYISGIRLQALIWSIYVHYSLLLIATVLIYGMSYFHVMTLQIFSLIILFNLRFQLKLRAYYKSGANEE
jgi:hypothetical protein